MTSASWVSPVAPPGLASGRGGADGAGGPGAQRAALSADAPPAFEAAASPGSAGKDPPPSPVIDRKKHRRKKLMTPSKTEGSAGQAEGETRGDSASVTGCPLDGGRGDAATAARGDDAPQDAPRLRRTEDPDPIPPPTPASPRSATAALPTRAPPRPASTSLCHPAAPRRRPPVPGASRAPLVTLSPRFLPLLSLPRTLRSQAQNVEIKKLW